MSVRHYAVVPDRDVGGSEVSATASLYVLDRDRVVELAGLGRVSWILAGGIEGEVE